MVLYRIRWHLALMKHGYQSRVMTAYKIAVGREVHVVALPSRFRNQRFQSRVMIML